MFSQPWCAERRHLPDTFTVKHDFRNMRQHMRIMSEECWDTFLAGLRCRDLQFDVKANVQFGLLKLWVLLTGKKNRTNSTLFYQLDASWCFLVVQSSMILTSLSDLIDHSAKYRSLRGSLAPLWLPWASLNTARLRICYFCPAFLLFYIFIVMDRHM